MSTDVVNPGVRDAEMLTANLAVRLLLAPVAGHNSVKSALKFDPLLYRIRLFAGLIPDLRFHHLCWVYQVIQPLGLFVPVLFGLHSSP